MNGKNRKQTNSDFTNRSFMCEVRAEETDSGHIITGRPTMKLTVDDEGLAIRVSLDTENNAEAKSLYSAVRRGDITGMSFMFVISDEEWEDLETDHPTRRIKEIDTIIEVSAVTFPAYADTEINARDKGALDNARSALENARTSRQASVDTDENLELLKLKTKTLIILGGL